MSGATVALLAGTGALLGAYAYHRYNSQSRLGNRYGWRCSRPSMQCVGTVCTPSPDTYHANDPSLSNLIGLDIVPPGPRPKDPLLYCVANNDANEAKAALLFSQTKHVYPTTTSTFDNPMQFLNMVGQVAGFVAVFI